MSRARNVALPLVCWIVLGVAPLTGTAQEDPAGSALIAQLDGLDPECTLDAFQNRPAMMELLAMGDRPIPALVKALESPSWSIRASALYVLSSNHATHLGGVDLHRLMNDTSPVVCAIAALADWESSTAAEVFKRPAAEAVAVRWSSPQQALDWLPDPYYSRRIDRFLEVMSAPKPLEDGVESLSEADRARVRADVAVGANVILIELQTSNNIHGHLVADKYISALTSIPPGDEDRLGVFLETARALASHSYNCHPGEDYCKEQIRHMDALCDVVEKSVWDNRNPYFLYNALWLLEEMGSARCERPLALLRRLAEQHPNPDVRAMAEDILKPDVEYELSAKREMDRRAARDLEYMKLALSRESPPIVLKRTIPPAPIPKAPEVKSPLPQEPPKDKSRTFLLVVGVLVAGALLGVFLRACRRKAG